MPSARSIEFPTELALSYDRPGPRYTSYPTAPHFTEAFGPDAYAAEIRRTNESDPPAPVSLYVHLPFCRELCWFCACNVVVTSRRERITTYLDTLEREIGLVAGLLSRERPVVQVHWGGGTPSYLAPSEIRRLMSTLRERFHVFAADAEISIEVDPREVSESHFEAIAASGFNRVSMGVQDFDPEVQAAIHRIQPEAMTRRAVQSAREHGISSVNIDLIYGLPLQTPESFERTLERALALEIDRIALFNYAHLPSLKKHQRMIAEPTLPAPEVKIDLLRRAIERFTGAGWVYVGMDHFAREDDELTIAQRAKTLYRNFQGYSTRAGADLVGLGATSIGSVGRVYAQNVKEIPAHRARVEAGRLPVFRGYALSDDDLVRRHVITRLMCDFEIDFDDVSRRFGIDFGSYFASELEALEPCAADGLVRFAGRGLEVTWPGRLLVRNVCMAFDRYLAAGDVPPARYSRTV